MHRDVSEIRALEAKQQSREPCQVAAVGKGADHHAKPLDQTNSRTVNDRSIVRRISYRGAQALPEKRPIGKPSVDARSGSAEAGNQRSVQGPGEARPDAFANSRGVASLGDLCRVALPGARPVGARGQSEDGYQQTHPSTAPCLQMGGAAAASMDCTRSDRRPQAGRVAQARSNHGEGERAGDVGGGARGDWVDAPTSVADSSPPPTPSLPAEFPPGC